MGFWVLVPGVGMGGGAESVTVAGPYCVCESEAFVPGGIENEAFIPGAVESQGDCC